MRVPVPDTGPKGCAQRCALLVLGKHADAEGICRVSQPLLREYMGVGKNSMIEALAALEGAGLIRRDAVYGANPHTGRNERKTDITTLLIGENTVPEGLDFKPTKPDQKVRKSGFIGLDSGEQPPEIQTSLKEPIEGDFEGESARDAFDQIFSAMPEDSRKGSSAKRMHAAWLKTADRPSTEDLLKAARAYRQFEGKAQAAHYWIIDETFREFARVASDDEPDWHRRMQFFRRGALSTWLDSWGPRPGEHGCLCPPEIQKQHPPNVSGTPDLGYC